MPGTALVISPLIALMKDQVDALRARGIRAETWNSSLSHEERWRVRDDLRSGHVNLLYVSPERLQQDGFLDLLCGIPLSFIAIDEAHCISHWGHDFRPDYRKLNRLRSYLCGPGTMNSRLPIIALTATATPHVQKDIVLGLDLQDPERVITGFRRPNLSFEVRQCAKKSEKLKTIRSLLREKLLHGSGTAIIYAATRKNVEKVAEELNSDELPVGHYHAGLAESVRFQAQEDFRTGRIRVLVATNAFGMGIDKSDVRLVIHHDVPGSIEAYYQEAGRAGRDGQPARCILLFNYADVATQEFLIDRSRSGPEQQHNQRTLLKQLVRFAYSTECRQLLFLEYFGDPDRSQSCESCDACVGHERDLVQVDEWTALASHQVMSTVDRLNGRFGKNRICDILQEGLLAGWSKESLLELADLLLESGHLKQSGLEFPVLCLTKQGERAVQGEIPVKLSRCISA